MGRRSPPGAEVAVLVTRQDVLEVLSRVPVPPEARETILALSFPVEYAELIAVGEPLGISRDWLINSMGGSP